MKTKRINYCKNDKFINFQVLSHCVHIPHFGYFILLNYKKTHMNFQLKSITDNWEWKILAWNRHEQILQNLYIYSNIIKLEHFPNDFCQIFCNGDGPAWTSHPVATLLRLRKDGSWHHQHQWRTMRRMLLRLRKDGSWHHPYYRLKFSMGLLGRGLYIPPSPGPSWNDTGDSPSPLLWTEILE